MQTLPISTAPQAAGGQPAQATAKTSGGAGATVLTAFAALLNGAGAGGELKLVLPASQAAKGNGAQANGAQANGGSNVPAFAQTEESDIEAQLAALLQGQAPASPQAAAVPATQDGKALLLADGETLEVEVPEAETAAADAVAAVTAASGATAVQAEDAVQQAAGSISKAQKPTLDAPQGGAAPPSSVAGAPNFAELARPTLAPALPAEPAAGGQPVPTDGAPPSSALAPTQTTGAHASQQMAGATATATAQHAAPPQPAAQQLAVSITRGAKEGADRIEIHLQPAELGKVDVKLEVGHDGRLLAVISAERADTLESLRRDVHQLERALNNAGLNTDRNSFSFAESGRDQQRSGGQANGGANAPTGGDDSPAEEAAVLPGRTIVLDRLGVDVTV